MVARQRLPSGGIVEPMLAKQIDALPTRLAGRRLLFEPKWDGWRALTTVDRHGEIGVWSRRGTAYKKSFPEVVFAAKNYLPPDTVIDGELVCWRDGRLDFGGVQQRNNISVEMAAQLAAEQPCHFIVFDVLRLAGDTMVDRPLHERRAALAELFAEIPATSAMALCMQTDDLDTARDWMSSLAKVGVEGIVIKPAASKYFPGQRGWEKVKYYATTEFVIGGTTGSLNRPEQLELGRYSSETGELTLIGRTVPLHATDAKKVAAQLKPAGPDHPWPDKLPGGWHNSDEIDYVRVEPDVVVEVRVDTAAQAGRWRHGLRFVRIREDVTPADIPRDMDIA